MVWLRLIFLILFTFPIKSENTNLSNQVYFNLFDLNNDKFISNKEIQHITDLFFQLIDKDNDNKISYDEINELDEIIDLLK